jgi:hypothetical protein
MTRLVFDYDNIAYKVGFATEDRWVEVKHLASGKTKLFKNQTEFIGRKKTEVGGWLGAVNEERAKDGKKLWTREDFTWETKRTPGRIEEVLHTTKAMINNIIRDLNADEYHGYVGKGDSFRVDRSTLIKYKGDRDPAERPLMKDEITEYIVKHQNGEFVRGLEADDWCIISGQGEDSIVVGIDKDSYGCPVRTYNPDKPELGIVNGNCFGELQVIEKQRAKHIDRDVRGYGRKWFYFQVAYGDDVDCYRSNAASDKPFGVMGAFDMLNHATNDQEALEALVKIYKHLYPEPKEFIGWRGDKIVVDWRYALSEVWDLARMWRTETDDVKAEQVFRKFNLWED